VVVVPPSSLCRRPPSRKSRDSGCPGLRFLLSLSSLPLVRKHALSLGIDVLVQNPVFSHCRSESSRLYFFFPFAGLPETVSAAPN